MNDMDSAKVTPTSVTDDLAMLDVIFDNAKRQRSAVADKLKTIIDELKIDFKEARQTEVKLQLVSTYLALLAAEEASVVKRVNSKRKQVEADNAGKTSAVVAEILSRITAGAIKLGNSTEQPSIDRLDAMVDRAYAESDLDPVMETELRTDPKDVD